MPAHDATAAHTFSNPLPYDDGVERTNPDPFILRYLGRYYCYSTGVDGVNVSISEDLTTWHSRGRALTDPARSHFWAPCILRLDGTFWMYVSSRPRNDHDPHSERLFVARGSSPLGPFSIQDQLFDHFAIDPHAVRDETTGGLYLFYSSNMPTGLDSDNPGTSVLVDRLINPWSPSCTPTPVLVPTMPEEVFQRNRFGDGRDWYTLEGPTYFTRHGRELLTYSGGSFEGPDYFIGYARATDAPPSTPLDQRKWIKQPSEYRWEPLIRRGACVDGTGHNSITIAPNLVDQWIVYHARDRGTSPDPGREQRALRIDRLRDDGDRLVAPGAPSTEQVPAPAAPTVSDNFSSADPGTVWSLVSGEVHAGGLPDAEDDLDNCPSLLTTSADEALLLHPHATACYVAEVWMRTTIGPCGARAGFSALVHENGDRVSVLVDAGSTSVDIVARRSGMRLVLSRHPIPPTPGEPAGTRRSGCGFTADTWHRLRVRRTFTRLQAWLDGVRVADVDIHDSEPGAVGLESHRTAARFAAFALTDHVDLWGPDLTALPFLVTASAGSGHPLDLTDEGLGPTTTGSASLEVPAMRGGDALTIDLGLLGNDAHAEFELARANGRVIARVAVSPGAFEVRRWRAGAPDDGAAEAAGLLAHRSCSVSLEVGSDGSSVLVGVGTTFVPLPVHTNTGEDSRSASGPSLRITLKGTRLSRLELTRAQPA